MTTAITAVSQPHTEQVLRTAAKLGVRRYRLGFLKYDMTRSIADQLTEIGARLRANTPLRGIVGARLRADIDGVVLNRRARARHDDGAGGQTDEQG